MNEGNDRDTGRLAIAAGAVAVCSAISIATYLAVQGPFGTINDLGNGVTGALGGMLAWRMRRQLTGRSADAGLAAALVGAGISVVGSALVVSGATGYVLAGLVSTTGFAGIGAWLVAMNRSDFATRTWPASLRRLGLAAGALMALGITAAPGIALRLDDVATMPAWVWLASVSWFGTYVAYPAWAISVGVRETRRHVGSPGVAPGSAVAD